MKTKNDIKKRIAYIWCAIQFHKLRVEKYQDWNEVTKKSFDAGVKVFCPKCNLFYASRTI